jgi:hypothetical protein
MGKINWNRVILGGLVAGAIVNIFEYVLNGVVLAKRHGSGRKCRGGRLALSRRHRLKPAPLSGSQQGRRPNPCPRGAIRQTMATV